LVKDEHKDGEKLRPNVKDLGHSETFAQNVKFSYSGRYFAVIGDSNYIIYQYPKFSNAGFGEGLDFVWSSVNPNQNMYATKTADGTIKVYKNFGEYKAFKTNYQVEGIFGGRLLAIKSKEFITFYDWEQVQVIRRIDVSPAPRNVYWSEDGTSVILTLEDTFYLLNYNDDIV
jgi:coatomer subunit beta'